MKHTVKISFATRLSTLFTHNSTTSQKSTSGLHTLSAHEITKVAGGPEVIVKPN